MNKSAWRYNDTQDSVVYQLYTWPGWCVSIRRWSPSPSNGTSYVCKIWTSRFNFHWRWSKTFWLLPAYLSPVSVLWEQSIYIVFAAVTTVFHWSVGTLPTSNPWRQPTQTPISSADSVSQGPPLQKAIWVNLCKHIAGRLGKMFGHNEQKKSNLTRVVLDWLSAFEDALMVQTNI